GFKIYIAGNIKQITYNSFYIDKLKQTPGITFIDTSKYDGGGINITLAEFLKLQSECKTDLTVFPEADHHISLFISQIFKKQKKIKGRIIGIFMRPFYYYRKKGMLERLRFFKHFLSRWKKDEQLFYDFFLNRFSLLDVALCIDENCVARHRNLTWLPDMFQQYAEMLVPDENAEQRIWIEKLNDFKEKNRDRFCLLYFGTAQKRRGYDLLLKMAVDRDACFIHCGLNNTDQKYEYNISELKETLRKDNRLMETNQYISDPVCIEHFFKAVSHLILPYRNFFGSSGVMLQALEYGIPVLVPNEGIMGYRVKKNNLGLTYNGNINSLPEQFDRFKKIPKETFRTAIAKYMRDQSPDNLKKILVKAIKGADQTIPVL
ncbi:MAG TPA: hypothetical protein VET23_09580, partial [Chitinophagaceae bacterium]|nr:hypothetical protein [Chitinophagaceae bacterium]